MQGDSKACSQDILFVGVAVKTKAIEGLFEI